MNLTETLTIATALGAATFGGAMYAFSAFVMHALDRTPTRAAVEAMQQINLSAPRAPLVLSWSAPRSSASSPPWSRTRLS